MSKLSLLVLMGLIFSASCVISFGSAVAQNSCPKGILVKNLEQDMSIVQSRMDSYRKAGIMDEYQKLQAQLIHIQRQIPYAYLEQELVGFRLSRDASCLSGVFSYIVGHQVGFQARSDQRWDMWFSGKRTREGLTDQEVVDLIRSNPLLQLVR